MQTIEKYFGTLEKPVLCEASYRTDDENGIIGQLAQQLDQQWLAHKENGTGIEFLGQLDAELATPHTYPSIFLKDGAYDSANERFLPNFLTAIRETVPRLRCIAQLTQSAPQTVRGIIVGGSMSYGRFYNIRGGKEGSDIDIFYIVEPAFFFDHASDETFPSSVGFDESERKEFIERAYNFPSLVQKINHLMMSHKFHLPGFTLSVKCMQIQEFEEEFSSHIQQALAHDQDIVLPIFDYKQGPYPLHHFTQYNFLHEPYFFPVHERQEDDSTITAVPSMIIADGHLYTGDHQNHCIPAYDIEIDRDGTIQTTLTQFHAILTERAKRERQRYGDAVHVINAQTRKTVLSPQVLAEALRKFL